MFIQKLIVGAVLFSASAVFAAEDAKFVGTLTQVEGQVQIFSNPGKTAQGPAPHASFEGMIYSVKNAHIGDKVEKNNIVRTTVDGQAKLVYENGDQMHVGPATAYKITWNETGKQEEAGGGGGTSLSLLYGKLRNVVSKTGPRNDLKVRTRDSVMGVRGTDFYVERHGSDKTTQVSTLRGAVAVKPAEAKPDVKPIEVKAGFSAVVAEAKPVEKGKPVVQPAPVELRETTKEELKTIKEVTVIKHEEKAPENLAPEIKKLEAKAVETTLQDIKVADPKLYQQVVAQKDKGSDAINNMTVEKIEKTAPSVPVKGKPTRQELERSEEDMYKRYFKNID